MSLLLTKLFSENDFVWLSKLFFVFPSMWPTFPLCTLHTGKKLQFHLHGKHVSFYDFLVSQKLLQPISLLCMSRQTNVHNPLPYPSFRMCNENSNKYNSVLINLCIFPVSVLCVAMLVPTYTGHVRDIPPPTLKSMSQYQREQKKKCLPNTKNTEQILK